MVKESILQDADVRLGSIATEMGFPGDVRFPPDSDRTADIVGPGRAIRRRKLSAYKRPSFEAAYSLALNPATN